MIVDHISNVDKYVCFGGRLARAIRFLAETDFSVIASNTNHPIDGDDLYASVEEYESKPVEKGIWEAHRRFIDIHYVLEGVEQIGYAHINSLKVFKEYDEKDDYLLLEGSGSKLICRPGTFIIATPDDAHMTGMCLDVPATVKKVIMKILI